jgi:hypothetical protein
MSRLLMVLCGVILAVGVVVFAAPVPKEQPKPPAEILLAVLGKAPVSPQMKALVRCFPHRPTIDYTYWSNKDDDNIFTDHKLEWQKEGLQIVVEENVITDVCLYNENVGGFGRYPGILPHDLTFDDDLTAFTKKLGEPDEKPEQFEKEVDNKELVDVTWAHYKKNTISVEFIAKKGGKPRLTWMNLTPLSEDKK